MAAHPTTPTLKSAEVESCQTEPFPDLPCDDELAEYYSSDQLSPETIKPNPGPALPTHYLCRGGGRFTPLIALDELPSHLKILGVPLSLSFKDIVDVGGTPCMPAVQRAKENYLVVLGSGEDNNGAIERFISGYSETVNVPSSDTINARLALALDGIGTATNHDKLVQEVLQRGKVSKGAMTTQRYNPTTPGVLGQKVYCTHWMRTGECDFTQQGCMFLHAMPDLDTLELLGFRSYPRWFREMPRDFQVMNAKDFQDVGLDQHRHAQKAFGNIPIDANWSNTANRYLPQRGPSGAGYPYLSQPPPMMHVNRAPWPQSGYNQPQLQSSQQDHSSYAHLPYNRPYTPDAFGNVQHYPPGYRGPPTEPALLSRTATPSMDILNRVHKPLSPEIASSQASPMHLAIAGPPGIDTSVPLPFHPHGMPNRPTNQQRQNNGENRNPNHGNPRANTPSSAQVRGKQSRRQGQNKDQKAIGTTTDKNPYSALAIEGAPVHGSTDN